MQEEEREEIDREGERARESDQSAVPHLLLSRSKLSSWSSSWLIVLPFELRALILFLSFSLPLSPSPPHCSPCLILSISFLSIISNARSET